MSKMPKIVAIISIAAGAIMIVLGVVTYYVVHRELADEHIVVADDAQHNAGKDVEGPFTAYSQAMVIKTHALEAGNGKTYAQLAAGRPGAPDGDDGVVPARLALHVGGRLRRRRSRRWPRRAVHPPGIRIPGPLEPLRPREARLRLTRRGCGSATGRDPGVAGASRASGVADASRADLGLGFMPRVRFVGVAVAVAIVVGACSSGGGAGTGPSSVPRATQLPASPGASTSSVAGGPTSASATTEAPPIRPATTEAPPTRPAGTEAPAEATTTEAPPGVTTTEASSPPPPTSVPTPSTPRTSVTRSESIAATTTAQATTTPSTRPSFDRAEHHGGEQDGGTDDRAPSHV